MRKSKKKEKTNEDIESRLTRLERAISVLDRMIDVSKKVPDALAHTGVVLTGVRAIPDNPLLGAIVSSLALKLAQSPALPSSAVGVGTLGVLGLSTIVPDNEQFGMKTNTTTDVENSLAALQDLFRPPQDVLADAIRDFTGW